MVSTFVTQSRIASFIASLSVPAAALDRAHRGPEEPHPLDVGRLAPDVLGAHEDLAGEPEPRAGRGGGHAVLARAGLGDDPPLPHPEREPDLAHGVVHLVRAGVEQVLALEPHLGAAEGLGEPGGEGERGGAPGPVAQVRGDGGPVRGVDRASAHAAARASSAGMSVSGT